MFRFQHQFIDDNGNYDGWGCVCLADVDNDGDLDFVTGGKGGGFLFWYEYDDGQWHRHLIADDLIPQVGGAATDLDGDGRIEIVTSEWSERGRLWWIVQTENPREPWNKFLVAEGHPDPHDIVVADLDSDGRPEVLVRDKHLRLTMYKVPPDPGRYWKPSVIASELPGDGTLPFDVTGSGSLDILCGNEWLENVNGDASLWRRHPLVSPELEWHPETRVAAGDITGKGRFQVVLTESEQSPAARMALFYPEEIPPRGVWHCETIVPRQRDLRALHSLQLADFDGDGKLEIFTAEMENNKTDGALSKPCWFIFKHTPEGWQEMVVLDSNLGTHEARTGDVTGNGLPDIVGKTWRPNKENGNEGRQHVDFLQNIQDPHRGSPQRPSDPGNFPHWCLTKY